MRHIWTYGTGSASYKLNGHDTKIYSLSWCPVEYNILNNENNRDVVLDSDVKDKSIFLCRAKVEMVDNKWKLLFQMHYLTFVNIKISQMYSLVTGFLFVRQN